MVTLGWIATLLIGILLGLMGAGGSILMVPVLVYLFGYSAYEATGFSLFIVGSTALVGAADYVRRGETDWRRALVFAVPSSLGALISRSLILPALPPILVDFNGFVLSRDSGLMLLFAVLMLAASVRMIRHRVIVDGGQPVNASKLKIEFFGLAVGLLAGLVGAGGGFLIVPTLVLLLRLSMRAAIGTSLLIIAAQSLVGFAGDVLVGREIPWPLLLGLAAVAIVGIGAGSLLARRVAGERLRTAFGWFVMVMAVLILVQEFVV
jgi:uncharacterized protein